MHPEGRGLAHSMCPASREGRGREEEEEGGAVRCWSHVGKCCARRMHALGGSVSSGALRAQPGYFYTDFSININQVRVKYMRE